MPRLVTDRRSAVGVGATPVIDRNGNLLNSGAAGEDTSREGDDDCRCGFERAGMNPTKISPNQISSLCERNENDQVGEGPDTAEGKRDELFEVVSKPDLKHVDKSDRT